MFKRVISLSFILFMILTGCSGNRSLSRRRARLMVPAGVDSSVAAKADTLADRLFVSYNREKRSSAYKEQGKQETVRSDTLWQALATNPGSEFDVSGNDSVRAIKAFNAGAKNLQELAAVQQSNGEDEVAKARIMILLHEARRNFERAVILNPFDLEAKSWLARVYQNLAVRFMDENENKKSIRILENLTRMEQGEHTLFARLAEAYYADENWQMANLKFKKAEQVLRSSVGLDLNGQMDLSREAALDTASLFYYVYYEGDTEIKMHDAVDGLKSLNRALQYASAQQERDDIHSYIDWINWDDGNTRAVELRDKFIALQDQKKYKEAAKGFEKLIPKLKTRKAIDETVWRLAVLEFEFLNRQNKGIERLKTVVKLAPKKPDGSPADTTYKKYFNSYGVMCHNLGLENYNKNRKFAFMYFKQAVTVPWESRAKSYLELAKLSRNNPKAVVESCERALDESQQLDLNEQMQANQLMVEAYKRSGRFNEARKYYAQWVELKKSHTGRVSKR